MHSFYELCAKSAQKIYPCAFPIVNDLSILISMKTATLYLHNDVESTKGTSHSQKWYHDLPHD